MSESPSQYNVQTIGTEYVPAIGSASKQGLGSSFSKRTRSTDVVRMKEPAYSVIDRAYYYDTSISEDLNSVDKSYEPVRLIDELEGDSTTTREPRLVDYDGNEYTTVIIGDKEWIVEDLRTTHYGDGVAIPNLTDGTEWFSATTGAYCWYDNDIHNKRKFGALYNQYAVKRGFYEWWFLPSQAELLEIYNALYLNDIGDFSASKYWSSTETSASTAIALDFSNGAVGDEDKASTYLARPCRKFVAAVGEYEVGDTSESGGIVFYKESPTYYYEVASSDLSSELAFSNITNSLIGTTGAAIGSGRVNTNLITFQVGSTEGSAFSCYRYSQTGIKSIANFKFNGVAQEGWRVADFWDFSDLLDYVGGGMNGYKLKDVGTDYWVIYDYVTPSTNEYGFSARAGGARDWYYQSFIQLKNVFNCWTTAEFYSYMLESYSDFFGGNVAFAEAGLSVRCVRDVVPS